LKLAFFFVAFVSVGQFRSLLRMVKQIRADPNNPGITSPNDMVFDIGTRMGYSCLTFFMSHLVGLWLIFDRAEYIRLRLTFESIAKYDRKEVKTLLKEYPFSHKQDYLYSDVEVRNKLDKRGKKIDLNMTDKEYKKKRNRMFVQQKDN